VEQGGQIQRRLEQRAAGLFPIARHHPIEKLLHGQRHANCRCCLCRLAEELKELGGEGGVGPPHLLLRLPEGVGDLALVLLQVDDLFCDNELLGVASQEVPKLLNVKLNVIFVHSFYSLLDDNKIRMFLFTVLRIRDVYRRSRIRIFSIPDPGFEFFPSRIPGSEFSPPRIPDPHQKLKYFNPKHCF
jgi:hypothetical protein